MFSFWSNDEEQNSDCSDENDSEKDKRAKPERFHYVGNDKRDEGLGVLKGNDVFLNNRNVNVFNERKRKMDDMLKDVWSVRKDVRVNANAVKATEIGTKSFYSRHAGVSGAGVNTDSLNGKNTSTDKAGGPTKTWSVPRTNYTYSDIHNTPLNQYDILDDNRTVPDGSISPRLPSDHSVEVQQRNIVNSLKHDMQVTGPRLTNRELSASTRRAQKFNNAYLRSTGLGKYTPGLTKPSEQHNDNDQNWRR